MRIAFWNFSTFNILPQQVIKNTNCLGDEIIFTFSLFDGVHNQEWYYLVKATLPTSEKQKISAADKELIVWQNIWKWMEIHCFKNKYQFLFWKRLYSFNRWNRAMDVSFCSLFPLCLDDLFDDSVHLWLNEQNL